MYVGKFIYTYIYIYIYAYILQVSYFQQKYYNEKPNIEISYACNYSVFFFQYDAEY